MIHLPALLRTGVTPRAGRFSLGRRCLFLEAILPCIPGPGLGQRHLGHSARIPERAKWLVVQRLETSKSSGWRKRSRPSELLRISATSRHYILSTTNGLVQQLVLWLIPLFSLSFGFGACRKSLVCNRDWVWVDCALSWACIGPLHWFFSSIGAQPCTVSVW